MKTFLDNTLLIDDIDLGQRLVCGEDRDFKLPRD